MKTIKVSEATNPQLDWLVAQIEGCLDEDIYPRHSYTINWEQMGSIIDRIDGVLMKRWLESNREGKCQVEIHNYDGDSIAFGPTLCIAAARCFIQSKLGETVEVPEELV